MTGLDAAAQWLLGGGGEILRFLLYLLVAWILIGALPRMRRDAAQRVPQVRGTARARMQEHSARSAGRGKPAEWWGWTAAWGALSVLAEGARFGRYMATSAWHGWGDHRRHVKALREKRPWRKAAPGSPAVPPPGDDPEIPPPSGGGGGGGSVPEEPPRTTPERPAEPPRPEEAPQPAGPSQGAPESEPAATGGTAGAEVIPFSRRNPSASESRGGTVETEITNLEAAERVVAEMQRNAQREFDAATAGLSDAGQALGAAEQTAEALAGAGVKGPVMEAFTAYYEAMERAELAARSKVAAAEQALAAANAARGALASHRDAADALAATGGAASRTAFYGSAG